MKTYDESFTLLTRDCDLKGTWRLSAVLEAMQEAAGAHSLLLGCGRDELLRKNIVWVLSRSELHINRYPRIGERITLHTFPMPNRICFFPRYYVFTDEHGELIGKAGTLWLLLDTQTRRMLPPGDIAHLIPDNRDLAIPMNLPATVGNLQGEEFITEYTPVYTIPASAEMIVESIPSLSTWQIRLVAMPTTFLRIPVRSSPESGAMFFSRR